MIREQHVPMRRCVACGTQRPKKELLHIVRTPQGDVTVDIKGKAAGRGAYLCRAPACWEQGLRKNHLEHALKVQISSQERQRLQEFADTVAAQA